jgi:hypothetical protein
LGITVLEAAAMLVLLFLCQTPKFFECGGSIAGGVGATLPFIVQAWKNYSAQLAAAQTKIENLADLLIEQNVPKAEAFAKAAAQVAAEGAAEGALVEVLGTLVTAIGGWEVIGTLALVAAGATAVGYVACKT